MERANTQSPPTSLILESTTPTPDPLATIVLTFDREQRAVGMYVGNGDLEFGPTATLRAFDGEGGLLGSVSTTVSNNDVTKFFGISRSVGGIQRVELSYNTSRSEEIDDLCFIARESEEEEGEADPTIELTSDRRVLPVAAQLVPLSAVPGSQLPAFSGVPGIGPVGSVPIGSVPIGSVPIGSVPIGSVPIGSVPIASVPIASVPIGSVPIGSVGLEGVPIGSVGLDGIQLSALPVDWAALLGTDVPIQSLTLADVYANATWRQKFEDLKLSNLMPSVFGGLTFPAILLGDATLSQIPPPGASSWCAAIQNAGGSCAGVNTATNTVAGIGIAGVPIASVPIGSVPIASVPIASVPIGSVPIASVDLEAARLVRHPPQRDHERELGRGLRADLVHYRDARRRGRADAVRDPAGCDALGARRHVRQRHDQRHHHRDPPALRARLGVVPARRPAALRRHRRRGGLHPLVRPDVPARDVRGQRPAPDRVHHQARHHARALRLRDGRGRARTGDEREDGRPLDFAPRYAVRGRRRGRGPPRAHRLPRRRRLHARRPHIRRDRDRGR